MNRRDFVKSVFAAPLMGAAMPVAAEKELSPIAGLPLPLVAALRARVWTACVWDTLHVTSDTLERISSREAYPGPRLIAPGLFSPLRRFEDANKPYLPDIARESFDAGHVVVTVPADGESYSVSYVTADDESMRVTGSYGFELQQNG